MEFCDEAKCEVSGTVRYNSDRNNYKNKCDHEQEMKKFLCPQRFSKSGLHGHHPFNCYYEIRDSSINQIAEVIKVYF